MKTFSLEMEISRQGHSHDVVWLLEIDWAGDVGRYSSRPVTIGGAAYRPILAAIEGLRLVMPTPFADGAGSAARLALINTAEEGAARFELQAEADGLEGRTARVGFVYLDPSVALEAADIIWIQTYQIERAALGTTLAELQMRESPAVSGRRLLGRRLLPGIDPDLAAEAAGRMIPIVFGRLERAPLLAFRTGGRGCLRAALQAADTIVPVEDASVFPDAGSAQVGDEVFAYPAVDRSARTLGRADAPVVRTAPAHHRAGTVVYAIPAGGFEYLVADHPCRSVGPLYAGERRIEANWFTAALETLDGRAVQKIVFPVLAYEVSYAAAPLTRRIDGREDPASWNVGPINFALDPLAAVDVDETSAASVAAGSSPLEIVWTGDLADGLSRYGPVARCLLEVRYWATQPWPEPYNMGVEVGRGAAIASFILARPPVGANPTQLYTQSFDMTSFVAGQGGWAFFGPSAGQRPYVRIIFGAGSDPAIVRIASIAFEVNYLARTGAQVFDRFDATVEGIATAGALIENPANVIEWLATNDLGLGWDAGAIDAANFAAVRAALSGEGWRLARRLGAPLAIESLLEQIARESGCRLVWEAGRLRLFRTPGVLLAGDAVATLEASGLLAAPLLKRGLGLAQAANVVRVRYGAGGNGQAPWVEEAEAGAAAAPYGWLEREVQAQWHVSSGEDLARRLALDLLAQAVVPRRTVELDLPLSQSHLERGDVVVVDHPASRLTQALGEIAAVEFADGRWVRATVALQGPLFYCWYEDAETFIAHAPGHTAAVFVLEGARVAALDRTGRLRVGGEVIERGLTPHAMAGPIEYDPAAHRLYFGAGEAGAGWAAVFAIDAQGRLLVRGTLRERADLAGVAVGGCHAADSAGFVLSCDLARAALRSDAAADRLDLAGTVVEKAWLQ